MALESSHFNISQQNISSNDSLLSNTNVTTDPALLQWNALSAFTLVLLITGTLGNGGLLLLFLKDRTLRTPFNVYLINLLTANFVCVVFLYPMDLMTNLHSSHWLLGNRACSLYIYTTYVIEAGIFHSHALIAVNRTWALVHPLSYRNVHSGRTAIFLCLGMWSYLNISMTPEVIFGRAVPSLTDQRNSWLQDQHRDGTHTHLRSCLTNNVLQRATCGHDFDCVHHLHREDKANYGKTKKRHFTCISKSTAINKDKTHGESESIGARASKFFPV